jgi:hypothetical protein
MTTDTRPPVELPAEVSVINVGLPLFADALREQGVPVQPVDWRIPAGGDLELVAALEELYGPRSDAIETANAEVVRRLDEGVPQLVDVTPAATVLSRLPERTLLHCGPAVDWKDVCDPLRRSMRAAAQPRAGPATSRRRIGCLRRARSGSNRPIDTTPWFRWQAPFGRPHLSWSSTTSPETPAHSPP